MYSIWISAHPLWANMGTYTVTLSSLLVFKGGKLVT